MRALSQLPAAARRGFTLVEVLVTTTLVGSFLGSLLLVVGAGTRAARTGMARQSADGQARRFTGGYERRLLPGIGHNVPQEAPAAFFTAMRDLAR